MKISGQKDKLSFLFVYDYANELLLRWNCLDLADYLRETEHVCHVERFDRINHNKFIRNFDCVIFYRTSHINTLNMIRSLAKTNVLVGYLIDDLIWSPNDQIYASMFESDFLVMPNKVLYKYAPQKPLLIREPAVGNTILDIFKDVKEKALDCVKIGFSRGHVQNYSVSNILEILNKISNINFKFEFHYWSNNNYFQSRNNITVFNHGYRNSVAEFWASFRDANLHILLNPLDDGINNDFNHAKSNPKYLEAALSETVLIAPRLRSFTEVIKDGYNGLFASSPDETFNIISNQIKDVSKLIEIGKNAKRDVLENHTYKNAAKDFVKKVLEIRESLNKKQNALNNVHNNINVNIEHKNNEKPIEQPNLESKDYHSYNFTINPILPGVVFEQTEIVNYKSISGFWIKGATYCNVLKNSLRVEVFNKNNLIFSGFIDSVLLRDNSWWLISFPKTKLLNNIVKIRIYNNEEKPISFYAAIDKGGKAAKIADREVNPAAIFFINS